MHNLNGPPKFVILTVSLFIFSANSLAKGVSPEEINAKECKKFVDSLFDDLSPHFPVSKYLTRENGTLNCTKEMNDNYKNGLPSYATHTPNDVKNYRKEKDKRSTLELRSRNKDTLEWIKKLCIPVADIYMSLYTEKNLGASKSDQVMYLRKKLHSVEIKTLQDEILTNLAYKVLDEIYSGATPITDDDAAEQMVAFYGKCQEMYEKRLFLK
jgi:hypothetical protein